MVYLRITLNPKEADALAHLAYSELRDVRDQIRFIVRNELERQGLLQDDIKALPSPVVNQEAQHVKPTT